MPRILRIFNRMIVGGPALHVSYLTKYMAPQFETQLVIGTPDPHEKKADFLLEQMGIAPIYVPEMGRDISMMGDLKAYQRIKQIISDYKPDIVHTHTSKPGAIGRWAAAACGVPVILHTFHGHVFHSYFSPIKTRIYLEIERKLAQKSTRLIAISERQKAELSETYKVAESDKIEVVPLGLDLDPFQENMDAKRITFRSEFKLNDATVAIGIIGRLAPIKNHSLFIDAIAAIHQHGAQPIKGFIIGDGECRKSLMAYCRQIGIGYSSPEHPDYSQPIIFTSWRSDIDVVNAGLDIITLTSLNEGTPVSIIEAQASGKPVVATICGGIQDIVYEGQSALLSPVQDPRKFIENLKLMVEDGKMRERFTNFGAAYTISRFGFRRLVDDMTLLYDKLLEEAGVLSIA